MPRASKLYLAYGSNLHKGQMRRRAPTAEPLGKVMLNDAKLIFSSVADVRYCVGSRVPCGVWRIYRSDEEALDRYEGVRGRHYSKEIVELDDGNEALLYVTNRTSIHPPSQYYYDLVRKGYSHFGLEVGYLENALKASYLKKDPDEYTLLRRDRQRKNDYENRLAFMPRKWAVIT